MDANTSADAEEFFQDAKTMTVSEVAIALEHYTNERRTRDPSYQPNLLVSKTRAFIDLVSSSLPLPLSPSLPLSVSASLRLCVSVRLSPADGGDQGSAACECRQSWWRR